MAKKRLKFIDMNLVARGKGESGGNPDGRIRIEQAKAH